MNTETDIKHECPVCTEHYDQYRDAAKCYDSHPPSDAITRVVGGESEVNLVEIVKRHSVGASEGELARLRAWLEEGE